MHRTGTAAALASCLFLSLLVACGSPSDEAQQQTESNDGQERHAMSASQDGEEGSLPRVEKTEEEWRALLSPEAFRVATVRVGGMAVANDALVASVLTDALHGPYEILGMAWATGVIDDQFAVLGRGTD